MRVLRFTVVEIWQLDIGERGTPSPSVEEQRGGESRRLELGLWAKGGCEECRMRRSVRGDCLRDRCA